MNQHGLLTRAEVTTKALIPLLLNHINRKGNSSGDRWSMITLIHAFENALLKEVTIILLVCLQWHATPSRRDISL